MSSICWGVRHIAEVHQHQALQRSCQGTGCPTRVPHTVGDTKPRFQDFVRQPLTREIQTGMRRPSTEHPEMGALSLSDLGSPTSGDPQIKQCTQLAFASNLFPTRPSLEGQM